VKRVKFELRRVFSVGDSVRKLEGTGGVISAGSLLNRGWWDDEVESPSYF
jgi:hypothetical protein